MPNASRKLLPECGRRALLRVPAAAALLALCACSPPEGNGGDLPESTHLGLGADHTFRTRSRISDGLGQTHVRYDHLYRGVRVWQGDTVAHTTAAGPATTGDLMADLRIGTDPALSANDAVAVAHRDLKPRGAYVRQPSAELVIHPRVREVVTASPMRGPGGELNALDIGRVIDGYTLAYYVHTELENGAEETAHTDYLVDAQTGSILLKWDALETAAGNGTGHSEYSGAVPLGTNAVAGGWELRDVSRGMSFATYDLGHGTAGAGTLYLDTDDTWGDGTEYVSGGSTTSASGQTAAVDAHYGIAMTYDYYYNVHGRNGIDGAGTATYSRVHYSTDYDNAFWDDSCFCMTFGDGSSFNVLTALDVAAHEMSHGVTSRTAGLVYYSEAGGLNESMSDIGGTLVEFYARGGGSTLGDTGGNWTLGEQLGASPLRYMYKPSLDGSSFDAWYYGLGGQDPHFSSGPMNRAFYFLSQGSSSDPASDSYSPYLPGGMTGVGNDRAARIQYRALTTYLISSSGYAGARTAFLSAAADLYGSSSAEYAAVQNAFAAINVGEGGGAAKPLQDGVPLTNLSGLAGTRDDYTIKVPTGQTAFTVQLSGGTGDADLYVRFGGAPTQTVYSCRSINSANDESCTWTNPAAGDWGILLDAHGSYSGVTLVADYSGSGGTSDPALAAGVPVTGLSGGKSSQQYWRLPVPSGTASVVFTLWGGTGDADLYVRSGARPTTTLYDCRPLLSGNNESCTLSNPAAGDWYVMIRGSRAYSGVSLKGQY